jgi:hypothetical protein
LELASGKEWHATFLSTAGHREIFHGSGVQDVKDSDLCSVFCLLREDKKRERQKERERGKQPGGFFPQGRHTLLAVPPGFSRLLGIIKS